MEGQYLTIISDLSHLTPPYEMSLCSVGVMGTSYVRDTALPDTISVAQGEETVLKVPNIYPQ